MSGQQFYHLQQRGGGLKSTKHNGHKKTFSQTLIVLSSKTPNCTKVYVYIRVIRRKKELKTKVSQDQLNLCIQENT